MKWQNVFQLLCGAGSVLLLCAVAACFAFWQFGSLTNGLRYLNGQNCVVEPELVDAGTGPRGGKLKASISIRNLTFRPLRVVGMNATCNCVISEALPLIVAPRDNQKIEFGLRLPAEGGRTEQMAKIMVSVSDHFIEVPVIISGESITEKTGNEDDARTSTR